MSTWKQKLIAVSLCLLLIACTRVNQENYDKVTSGMTYDQVINILGEPTKTTQLGLGELSTTTAIWECQNAKVVIQFFNDKVKMKNFQSKGKEHIEIQ